MFSGGSYDEVRRWLANFLRSHAKREDPRIEAELVMDEAHEGKSYGARLRLDEPVIDLGDFDYREVADQRGTLAWCAALARRTREQARGLLVPR